MAPFPHLFSPLEIRGLMLKNRIFSSGHQTMLVKERVSTEAHAAYYAARAKGGAALIVIEVATVDPRIATFSETIDATSPASIPGYRRIREALEPYGCRVFAQLFHPGRIVYASPDGTAPVAYAPSPIPDERFHTVPRALSPDMIGEIVNGYGVAARNIEQAGIEGVEITAAHGYLAAQFLNPHTNRRADRYGGSLENRLRFLREAIAEVRARTGPRFIVGIRISGDDMAAEGLPPAEVIEAGAALDGDNTLDFFHVAAGSAATLAGSQHIVPPMFMAHGYVAPLAAAFKKRVKAPVFVAGRINDPRIAEGIIARGEADLCAMTRALICDPEMPSKAFAGRLDDIRACIGCNQACIGHALKGYPISCIQYPESGRELEYGRLKKAAAPRRVLVAGGGPGGMKAAAVAAARGHRVTLYEKAKQLGGAALLAQRLPSREEFGGIVTNLAREMEQAGVEVRRGEALTRAIVMRERPDAVILATGARARAPEIEIAEGAHVVEARAVVADLANVGQSVVIADWRGDWVGLGLADKLARDGCRVRLCVNGHMAGELIQQYVRDHWLGRLHRLGVEITPLTRLKGVDEDTVYFQHVMSGEPILCQETDTLVLALAAEPDDELARELADVDLPVHLVGDCLAPRTAEEAVYDGLKVAWNL